MLTKTRESARSLNDVDPLALVYKLCTNRSTLILRTGNSPVQTVRKKSGVVSGPVLGLERVICNKMEIILFLCDLGVPELSLAKMRELQTTFFTVTNACGMFSIKLFNVEKQGLCYVTIKGIN